MVDFAREQEKEGRQLPPIIARLRGTGEAEAAAIVRASPDQTRLLTFVTAECARESAVHQGNQGS